MNNENKTIEVQKKLNDEESAEKAKAAVVLNRELDTLRKLLEELRIKDNKVLVVADQADESLSQIELLERELPMWDTHPRYKDGFFKILHQELPKSIYRPPTVIRNFDQVNESSKQIKELNIKITKLIIPLVKEKLKEINEIRARLCTQYFEKVEEFNRLLEKYNYIIGKSSNRMPEDLKTDIDTMRRRLKPNLSDFNIPMQQHSIDDLENFTDECGRIIFRLTHLTKSECEQHLRNKLTALTAAANDFNTTCVPLLMENNLNTLEEVNELRKKVVEKTIVTAFITEKNFQKKFEEVEGWIQAKQSEFVTAKKFIDDEIQIISTSQVELTELIGHINDALQAFQDAKVKCTSAAVSAYENLLNKEISKITNNTDAKKAIQFSAEGNKKEFKMNVLKLKKWDINSYEKIAKIYNKAKIALANMPHEINHLTEQLIKDKKAAIDSELLKYNTLKQALGGSIHQLETIQDKTYLLLSEKSDSLLTTIRTKTSIVRDQSMDELQFFNREIVILNNLNNEVNKFLEQAGKTEIEFERLRSKITKEIPEFSELISTFEDLKVYKGNFLTRVKKNEDLISELRLVLGDELNRLKPDLTINELTQINGKIDNVTEDLREFNSLLQRNRDDQELDETERLQTAEKAFKYVFVVIQDSIKCLFIIKGNYENSDLLTKFKESFHVGVSLSEISTLDSSVILSKINKSASIDKIQATRELTTTTDAIANTCKQALQTQCELMFAHFSKLYNDKIQEVLLLQSEKKIPGDEYLKKLKNLDLTFRKRLNKFNFVKLNVKDEALMTNIQGINFNPNKFTKESFNDFTSNFSKINEAFKVHFEALDKASSDFEVQSKQVLVTANIKLQDNIKVLQDTIEKIKIIQNIDSPQEKSTETGQSLAEPFKMILQEYKETLTQSSDFEIVKTRIKKIEEAILSAEAVSTRLLTEKIKVVEKKYNDAVEQLEKQNPTSSEVPAAVAKLTSVLNPHPNKKTKKTGISEIEVNVENLIHKDPKQLQDFCSSYSQLFDDATKAVLAQKQISIEINEEKKQNELLADARNKIQDLLQNMHQLQAKLKLVNVKLEALGYQQFVPAVKTVTKKESLLINVDIKKILKGITDPDIVQLETNIKQAIEAIKDALNVATHEVSDSMVTDYNNELAALNKQIINPITTPSANCVAVIQKFKKYCKIPEDTLTPISNDPIINTIKNIIKLDPGKISKSLAQLRANHQGVIEAMREETQNLIKTHRGINEFALQMQKALNDLQEVVTKYENAINKVDNAAEVVKKIRQEYAQVIGKIRADICEGPQITFSKEKATQAYLNNKSNQYFNEVNTAATKIKDWTDTILLDQRNLLQAEKTKYENLKSSLENNFTQKLQDLRNKKYLELDAECQQHLVQIQIQSQTTIVMTNQGEIKFYRDQIRSFQALQENIESLISSAEKNQATLDRVQKSIQHSLVNLRDANDKLNGLGPDANKKCPKAIKNCRLLIEKLTTTLGENLSILPPDLKISDLIAIQEEIDAADNAFKNLNTKLEEKKYKETLLPPTPQFVASSQYFTNIIALVKNYQHYFYSQNIIQPGSTEANFLGDFFRELESIRNSLPRTDDHAVLKEAMDNAGRKYVSLITNTQQKTQNADVSFFARLARLQSWMKVNIFGASFTHDNVKMRVRFSTTQKLWQGLQKMHPDNFEILMNMQFSDIKSTNTVLKRQMNKLPPKKVIAPSQVAESPSKKIDKRPKYRKQQLCTNVEALGKQIQREKIQEVQANTTWMATMFAKASTIHTNYDSISGKYKIRYDILQRNLTKLLSKQQALLLDVNKCSYLPNKELTILEETLEECQKEFVCLVEQRKKLWQEFQMDDIPQLGALRNNK